MTSFNIQSEFLDLKKTYQNFEYESLIGQGLIVDETANNKQQIYQGMTQNTYLFVQEKNVLIKDIQNMSIYFTHRYCSPNPHINLQSLSKFPFDKVRDRVCFIFQKYQQQPTLLDTLLEPLIQPIMNAVKEYLAVLLKTTQTPTEQLHSMLQIIYQLTKVRGKKWVMQYLPHEVKDLYPAIAYLVREKDDQNTNWQSRYVILLWLGVIVLVPFDLDRMDSGGLSMPSEEGGHVTEIVDILIQIAKLYLKSLTKTRQASALFLGKLFTRPDIQKRKILQKYIHYAITKLKQLQNSSLDSFFVCGLYYSLSQIFKRVQRSQLLPMISPILAQLQFEREQGKDNGAKKELKMKLLKRIGLCYLKPRMVKWAYTKKKQSLTGNLSKSTTNQIKTNTTALSNQIKKIGQENNQVDDNQLDYYRDVDKNNLELIIDMLVDGLSEKQTSVREQASKGLGMISGRLSQDMVLDIVQYTLELNPNPRTQHAICLTIAELTRRNLLSPQKVAELYPLMKDSLLYQRQQGGYSVGQSVRDAACYMTWSVARGYQQGGKQLGVSLMIAACFDRQVGCRRAASAAYQQLVGRVGDVPNGIQILTEADYFTLGLQKNAFLNVAIFVASYEAYFQPFVEHLSYQKLRHWDLQMKRISACSLSLMCPLNPRFFAEQLLPSVTKYLESEIMNIKLGTIIGIGEIMLGLRGLSQIHQLHNQMKDSVFLKSLTQNQKKLIKAGEYMTQFKAKYDHLKHQNHFHLIQPTTLSAIINNISLAIKDGKIFKGKAGQSFRIYTCRLLQCFALCNVQLSTQYIQIFSDFIQQNIKNPLQLVLNSAVKCLKPFLIQYHIPKQDQKYIKNIIHTAKSLGPLSKGYTLALSRLSKQVYQHHLIDILNALEHCCQISKENDDPQKRKYATLGIEAFVIQIGFDSEIFKEQHINKVFQILFKTINDYTMDKRGDIGSIVRESSMSSMIGIIKQYCSSKNRKWIIQNDIIQKMIGLFLQQLSQKIDRVRLLAGSLLQTFFDEYQHQFKIPYQQELKGIFCQSNIRKLIKENQNKIDKNLQTQVIQMEMKIQQTIFHESDRYLIYFWNLPHSVFPIVVPLLSLDAYSLYILKGLCTSTGGISQSIIKYSLHQLGNYLSKIYQDEHALSKLFKQILQLLTAHYRDDRIIIPMYKTLDYILQRNQIISWSGLKKFDTQIFKIVDKEVSKTKNIVKVSASTGIYVSLLSLNNIQTKQLIIADIIKILCSDLPKARKILADKLLLLLMSQQDFNIFNQEITEQLTNILSQNDFLDEKLPIQKIKGRISVILKQ